jgi:predicted N-acyltransferase
MPYSCRVFDSIGQVELTAWERVRSQCGGSIFMDPRFIAGLETSMKQMCRFWYVLVYEDSNRPVACAGLAAMTVDLTDFADRRLAWIIKQAPKWLSRFRRLKVLFCGLPGSPGDKSLMLTSPDASPQILSMLDAVMCNLAAEIKVDAIIYKEFERGDLGSMDALLDLGYRRISIPPMHLLRPSFENFSQYCAALKTRYRQQINRSTRKLKNSGIKPLVLTDPEEITKVYTPDVHSLYCEMVRKSDVKLELFPIEYFQQLALRLEGEVELIALMRDSRVLAFGWCLHDRSTYHMMYAGVDYQLNRDFDLYFNLMYAGFDQAFRKPVARIHVGQTATVFKSRMGCYSEPRYVFTRGRGPVMSRAFHYGARFLVIQKPSNPPSNVFRSGVSEHSK